MTIFSDDPQALEKLRIKLENLESQRAKWKLVKKSKVRNYDNSPEDQKWWIMGNLSQNIRSVKQRILKLEDLEKKGIKLERKTFYKDNTKMFVYEEVKTS